MNETKIKRIRKFCKGLGCCLIALCAFGYTTFAPKNEGAVQSQESPGSPPSDTQSEPPIDYFIINDPVEELIEQDAAEESIEPEAPVNPYAGLEVTNTEKELLARMAYSEAGNQSFEGQVAVIQVALNRYMHEAYSGSIKDILLAPHQFVVGKYFSDVQMDAVEAALAGEPVLDLNTDVVYFSTGVLRYGSYYKTIGDHVFRTYI